MAFEQKQLNNEKLVYWAEGWGVSLAFAVTQSIEASERIVADAIVGLVAAHAGLPTAVDFASALWLQARPEAFHGFSQDEFFRLGAAARAAVILKVQGKFSIGQISKALQLNAAEVEALLENARLVFSRGRPWVQASPGMTSAEVDGWTSACPQWQQGSPQNTFAKYVGQDLDPEADRRLHSHLVVCESCRNGLSNFKKHYLAWAGSLPRYEADPDLRAHLASVARQALRARGPAAPSLWSGFAKLLADRQFQLLFVAVLVFLVVRLLSG